MSTVKLWLCLMLGGIAFAQYPTIPVVQSRANAVNAATLPCDFRTNVTAGNIGVVIGSWFSSVNTPSVSDTRSSSYTQKLINTANTEKIAVYTTTFGSSGANTITFAVSGASFMNLSCLEISPTAMTTTLDVSNVTTFSGTPATITAGNVTTTANTDFVLTFTANDNNTGYQVLSNANQGRGWKVGTSAGADSASVFVSIAGATGVFTGLTIQNLGSSGTLATVAFLAPSIAITSPSTIPDGSLTNAYNYTLLASGGSGAYTWSITSGSLQSGLSLNSSTGAITGTPTGSSQNAITFQVTDGSHTSPPKTINLKVGGTANTIAFVQGTSSTVVSSLAFGSNVTAGNLLVVGGGTSQLDTEIPHCTDSVGTSYSLIGITSIPTPGFSSFDTPVYLMAGFAGGSGANTVSCGTNGLAQIAEFSNVSVIASDNVTSSNGTGVSGTGSGTSNSLTTLVPNELLLNECGLGTNAGTATVTAPLTSVGTGHQDALGYKFSTTVTGYTASCSYTSNTAGLWDMVTVALRPSAGAIVVSNVPNPWVITIN